MTESYVSAAQARRYLGVSRFIFDRRIRPELTEIRHGPRTVVFRQVELDAYLAESAGMFKKKTVSDALEHAWKTKWQHARGAFKKENLKDKVDDELGKEPLSKLDYNRLEEWVQELRDADRAPATIKSRVSCLMTALKLAAKKGWIKTVPSAPDIETTPHKVRYLLDEPDEEALLLDACGCVEYRIRDVMQLVIVFMLDTGCRVSELTRVRWRDLKENRRGRQVVFEERKRGGPHSVPLTKRAGEAIDALLDNDYWLKRVRGADKSETRSRSAQNWLTHQFGLIRDHANMPDVTLHTLRHTCASRLVQSGVSLYDVRDVLGHKSITQTEQYAHLAPKNLDRAVAALENRTLPDKVRRLHEQ